MGVSARSVAAARRRHCLSLSAGAESVWYGSFIGPSVTVGWFVLSGGLYPLGVGFAIVRSPSPSGANLTFGASRPAGGASLVSVLVVVLWGMKGEAVRLARIVRRGGQEKAVHQRRGDRPGPCIHKAGGHLLGKRGSRLCSKTLSRPSSGRQPLVACKDGADRSASPLRPDRRAGWPDWHTRARADC